MYRLVYSKDAVRSLRKMANNVSKKICSKLEKLAQDPYSPNNNVKLLIGSKDNYRLRIGNWRALYMLNKKEKQIIIVEIAIRGEVYKS